MMYPWNLFTLGITLSILVFAAISASEEKQQTAKSESSTSRETRSAPSEVAECIRQKCPASLLSKRIYCALTSCKHSTSEDATAAHLASPQSRLKKWIDNAQYIDKKWIDHSQYVDKKWIDSSQFVDKKWIDSSQFVDKKSKGPMEKKWIDNAQYVDKKWLDHAQYVDKKHSMPLDKKWIDNAQYVDKKWLDSSQFVDKKWIDSSQFVDKKRSGPLDKKWIDSSQFVDKKWIDNAQYVDKKWIDNAQYVDKKWLDSSQFVDKKLIDQLPYATKRHAMALSKTWPRSTRNTKSWIDSTHYINDDKRSIRAIDDVDIDPRGVKLSEVMSSAADKRWVDPLNYGLDKKRSVYMLTSCFQAHCAHLEKRSYPDCVKHTCVPMISSEDTGL